MRAVGVEEELLLVDSRTGAPVALADSVLAAGEGLEDELQQQVEIGTRPCTTLTELDDQLRHWRGEAAAAAEKVGARVVATGTSPVPVVPELTVRSRYRALAEAYGLTAAEQLTCGCHVHVDVASPAEGVAALDRIRVWLPVLLALSANSPYWQGVDSGYASYRSRTWTRLPTAGPTDTFGSAEHYDAEVERLLASGVALDQGMVYFDARLSHHLPTLEVRIADVCLRREDTLLIAASSGRWWRRRPVSGRTGSHPRRCRPRCSDWPPGAPGGRGWAVSSWTRWAAPRGRHGRWWTTCSATSATPSPTSVTPPRWPSWWTTCCPAGPARCISDDGYDRTTTWGRRCSAWPSSPRAGPPTRAHPQENP